LKLLFILPEYLPDSGGGIITFYANLLPRLVERGNRVKVLVANHSSLDRSERIENGVEVEYLKSSFVDEARLGCKKFRNDALWAYMPLAWGAYQQAKGGEGFDIVEATDWALLYMPWVVSTRKAKVVVSLHGSNGQVDWYSNPASTGFDAHVLRLAEVASLRLADFIHANSRANAEFWKTKLDREIRVIPPVFGGFEAAEDGGGLIAERGERKVDLTTEDTTERLGGREMEQPKVGPKGEGVGTTESKCTEVEAGARLAGQAGASEPSSLASKLADSPVSESLTRSASAPASSNATSYSPLATAPQAPMGLVVGRLQNWKGAEVLCKALELVEGIQIEWVGRDTPWGNSGETASGYLEKNYPSVWGSKLIWRGPLEHAEAMEKISNAAFFVVPSIWDVFNLTAAEAMTRCLPIICSRKAGAEMLIEDGISGFLFDPDEPKELADCIKKVCNMGITEKAKFGKNAYSAVKSLLGSERILDALEASYSQIANELGTPKSDPWLTSFLYPTHEKINSPNESLVHRAIRKVGRILANV